MIDLFFLGQERFLENDNDNNNTTKSNNKNKIANSGNE